MIKIVVSSFYNTLINYEEAIDASTMLEIDRIRNKGILFTILTISST
jgi:hydroxymethylpyrimidine pyrophosphatase-like HAD family hydrolase